MHKWKQNIQQKKTILLRRPVLQTATLATCLILSGTMLFPFSGQSETLQEAVKETITTNPDIRSGAHSRLAVDEEVRQAKAGYYPVIGFETGRGWDRVDRPYSGNLDPQETKFTLRQNLFAGLSTKNEVERQKARVQSEGYLLQSVTDNTALQTVNAYLDVLRNEAIVDLAKENLVLHERISDQIQLRSESGVDRGADMDQIQSRLNLAESNLIISQQNLHDAETAYLAVVGHTPSDLTRPALASSLLPKTLEEAKAEALSVHPRLKSAMADLEARKYQDEVAKAPFMPIIDLEADKIWNEDLSSTYGYDDDRREELIVYFRLRYNLFNGWRDDARKAQTSHLINEAREIRNHTHRQVEEAIGLSWRAYEAAQKKTGYLQQRLQFATATANAYTEQWNINQRTLLDVLDAEAERIDSAKQLVDAEYDALYSQYRILHDVGRLIPVLQLDFPEESKVEPIKISMQPLHVVPPEKATDTQKKSISLASTSGGKQKF